MKHVDLLFLILICNQVMISYSKEIVINLGNQSVFNFRSSIKISLHQKTTPSYFLNFSQYNVKRFQNHFKNYDEQKILSLEEFYLYDAFVKFAKTLPRYKEFIIIHHKKYHLKSFFDKSLNFLACAYTPGLQKRFCNLFKEIKRNEKQKPIPVLTKSKKSNASPVFYKQTTEYKKALPCYKTNNPRLYRHTKKRIEILNDLNNPDFSYVSENYQLSDLSLVLLHKHDKTSSLFEQCYGNQYQQQLHREAIEIIKETASLKSTSTIYQYSDTLMDSTIALCEYNHNKQTEKASLIADFCWALLDYGAAIAEGALIGITSVITTAVDHPFQTVACAIAGEYILAYQLSKLIYNVADIGLTTLTDNAQAQEKWEFFLTPINNIIGTIQAKQVTVRDALKVGTAFAVGLKAQSKLRNGLNKFYQNVQTHAIQAMQNNVAPEKYITNSDGSLLRVSNESTKLIQKNSCPPSCINRYTDLKKELRIEEFTSVIKVTKHGAERLIERGFTPQEALNVIKNPTYIKTQFNKAQVFIKNIEEKYNVIVISEKGNEVITVFRKISEKAIKNLGNNYGWK
jgi:hypothetical protein